MATSYYDIGTITLTNGSAVVTGVGTAWLTALISGGNIIVQAPGNLLPIASVDSDSQITAELEWTGASGTYAYRLQRDSAYMKALDDNSRNLSYMLSEIRNGTLYKYDAAGDLADRALFDAKPKGFGYLVTIGVDEPEFFVKASAADGDWAGPFAYGTGPIGPQGPVGFLDFKGDYDAGETYVANDGVRHNGSSWVALQNVPISTPPPNLSTTENAYWSLLAIKGQDGAGTGDMQAATYDPQNKVADAFARENHSGQQATDTVSGLDDALEKRVRVDAAQSFDVPEKMQARANIGATGNLRSRQIFTSSGTWTKPAGCLAILVELVGGGGGGRGGPTSNSAAGGGAGGYCSKFIDASSLTSEVVTIGAGGSGGSIGNSGNSGGATSFGSHCSATGGGGGSNSGGAGGVGTGGDINAKGQSATARINADNLSSTGATSNFSGGGAPGVGFGSAGADGLYGSGGGGGTAAAGGNGGSGLVIVWEYY